jgi:hypothetical protein
LNADSHPAATGSAGSPGGNGRAGDHPQRPPPELHRRSGSRRALCIGIDSYPTEPLTGCVNDSRAWANELRQLGFNVDHLENAAATRQRIQSAIDDLLRTTPDGGQVAIQFSGHGSQLPCTDPQGNTRFDRALVPVDHRSDGCVLDDDIYLLLLPHSRRVRITLFLDCCHRQIPDQIESVPPALAPGQRSARYLPPDSATLAAQARRNVTCADLRREIAQLRAGNGLLPWVHLAACAPDESAFESGGRGEFSVAALRHLGRAVNEAWTPLRFLTAIRQSLGARGQQTPQLLALAANIGDRPLLGGGRDGVQPSGAAAAFGGVDSLSLRDLIRAVEALSAEVNALRESPAAPPYTLPDQTAD